MSAPDGRVPRPRALHCRPPIDPPVTLSHESRDAWFSYHAPDDRIVWSEGFGEMLGHQPAENEPGRQVVARYVHRDDQATALGAITRSWTTGETVHVTIRMVRADGGWFDADCQIDPIVEPDGTVSGVRGVVQDVSARERARREVERLARRGDTVQASVPEPDPATGLLTRAGFADELDRAMRRGGGAVLVVRVEPDRGETSGGHARPDRNADLLHHAARVLENVVRGPDLLGRVGPYEIGVLLAGASWALARRQADLIVESLRAHPFVLPDAWSRARAWAGLVRFQPGAEAGSHDLLIDAEQAWRQARHAGRPITLVAHPVPVRERQGSYRERVADALGTDRFTLYSQPILDLQSNEITRHELLLRVLDETDGPQSPIQVLDTAERLDAVFDIDLWVVERAMQLAAEHTDALPADQPVRPLGRRPAADRRGGTADREVRRQPGTAHLRDHRDRADRQPHRGPALRRPGPRPRLRAGPGRLRLRLRVVPLPAALPDRPGQDRRRVRGRPGRATRRTRCSCGPWCRCARRTGSTPSPSSSRTSRPCACCASSASTTSRVT